MSGSFLTVSSIRYTSLNLFLESVHVYFAFLRSLHIIEGMISYEAAQLLAIHMIYERA